MGRLKRFKQWRSALIHHFESHKEEKEKFIMLAELVRAMPSGFCDMMEKEGDQDFFFKLVMAIYLQLQKKKLIDALFNVDLLHLELVESLVQVLFFSSVQLKLTSTIRFKDDDNNLLHHLPGTLIHKSPRKLILNTNILSVLHGAMTWKKVKLQYELSVSTVTCAIDTQLVQLWNTNDNDIAYKLSTLKSLLSELIITSNSLHHYCAEFGYPLKQTLCLVSKNANDTLYINVPSQTATFRGQQFHRAHREGPFLRFEHDENTMLEITVVPTKHDKSLYRWSMCIYLLNEGHWEPDFRCSFKSIE